MVTHLAAQYDASFYEEQSRGSRNSARVVVPIVDGLIHPKSVLDVGCGMGTWLAEWQNHGVTDAIGLDGEYVDQCALQIERSLFRPVDLTNGFSLDRKFDLVQSLEVAEHIDESRADQFIHSLTCHGDLILFSAAIPGQGGTHHVNEQWPSYWVEKFSRAGFQVYDIIRPIIWMDSRIDPWYRQNILIFSKERTFDAPESLLYDVVHPDILSAKINDSRNLHILWHALPAALSHAVRLRLHLSDDR